MPRQRPKDEAVNTLPGDVGHDFEDEHDILTSRPKIEWDPPAPEEGDEKVAVADPIIQENRQRAEGIIEGYKRVAKLTDELQKKIDDRVKKLGGLEVELDPVKDAATISAIKRRFPEVKDPTKLDYATYKKALACAKPKLSVPALTTADILKARQNPTTTGLGGFGEKPGALRSQNTGPSFGNPVDLEEFQKNATLDLFKMMEELIKGTAQGQVLQHELSKKHG
tara:strand:- start:53 stop:724 length:672 start_codon:yes stop_codon:yes gene_type:complete